MRYLGMKASRLALTGLAMWLVAFVPAILLGIFSVKEPEPNSLLGALFMLFGLLGTTGLLLFLIGGALAMKESRHKTAFAEVFGGLAMMAVSVPWFLWTVSGNVTGVAIIGFIPLPLVVLPITAFIVAVVAFLHGIAELRK